jgi:heterodisulfide reductase subunit B
VKFSYYPGCSLHGSSKGYDISTLAVCKTLGIELIELQDWICCGASSGHSWDEVLAIGLPAQNLKIAEKAGLDVAVPCAACYNRLKGAEYAIRENETVRKQMTDLVDHDFHQKIKILNLVELIRNRIDPAEIQSRVTNPLKGLKVACYYGCLLVRPTEVVQFDDPEHPVSMDEIMEAIGAVPVQWSFKTECCGGSFSLTRDDIVVNLVGKILDLAKEAGAHAVVTACPLCFENLDMRQNKDFPVFYFTELLGLAFGLKESAGWIKKHIVDPNPVLKPLGLL